MTSYLIENKAENLQNGDVYLAQIFYFEMEYLESIEVGDGSFFCIFHALSFELNFSFDRRFPLKMQGKVPLTVSVVQTLDKEDARN